jgi:2-C-methyl-D-erythritol 4-phosphate cytidylyltransferase
MNKDPKFKKNIAILLSGGFSSRFNSSTLKQLYNYNSIPLFLHSLKILSRTLDIVVVIVNSLCFNDIKYSIEKDCTLNKCQIYLSTNDENCRMESIYNGLCFIQNNLEDENISNLIIHDAARPFIKEKHITDLLNLISEENLYAQYFLKLVNGLLKKNESAYYEEVNREEFIEICTPVCINFKLFKFIFLNYMKKEMRISWEFIPVLDLLKIKYELVCGDDEYKYLRKVTKLTDLEYVI